MNTEPVLIANALGALIALAIAFGVPITPDEKATLLGAVLPVYAIVAGFFVRSRVTPTSSAPLNAAQSPVAAPPTAPEGASN